MGASRRRQLEGSAVAAEALSMAPNGGYMASAESDPSLVRYVRLVGWRRLPGIWPLDPSLSVGLIPMLLWSALVVNLLATRQSDLPLRRSFRVRCPAAALLVRAGFLVVWLPLNALERAVQIVLTGNLTRQSDKASQS